MCCGYGWAKDCWKFIKKLCPKPSRAPLNGFTGSGTPWIKVGLLGFSYLQHFGGEEKPDRLRSGRGETHGTPREHLKPHSSNSTLVDGQSLGQPFAGLKESEKS
jgi:hypothetical protein